jgi:hypothetical protein
MLSNQRQEEKADEAHRPARKGAHTVPLAQTNPADVCRLYTANTLYLVLVYVLALAQKSSLAAHHAIQAVTWDLRVRLRRVAAASLGAVATPSAAVDD